MDNVKRGRRPKYESDPHLKKRLYQLVASGAPLPEVAQSLGVDRSTVYRWMRESPDIKRLISAAQQVSRRDLVNRIIQAQSPKAAVAIIDRHLNSQVR
jgi:transposase-like protein